MIDSKGFIKQILGYVPSQIIPALSSLGIILILTRNMSVANYGFYSLLITSTNLAVTIITQWIIQSILFYRPKYKSTELIKEFDGLILKIYALLTTIVFSVLLIVIPLSILFNIDYLIFSPVILIILFNSIFIINQSILQSDMRIGKYSLQISLSTLIKLILVIFIALKYNADITLILWVIVFSYFLFVIPKYFELIENIRIKDKREINLKDFLLEMLQYGMPMLGWFLATSLISITDRYILAVFESTYVVGLYAANVAIVSSALGLIFAPFIKTIHPIIMNSASKDNIDNLEITKLMTRFSLLFVLLAIPIITSILILRKEISILLLGPKYVEGSIIIPFIILGIFLWNLAMIGHKGFEIHKNTNKMFIYALIACSLNIIFNFILIPYLGVLGAGIASLIAYSSYPILIKINSKKNTYWNLPLKPIFFITIVGLFTYFVTNSINNILFFPSLSIRILVISLLNMFIYSFLILIVIKNVKIKII